MTDQRTEPTMSERARSALAQARAGSLVTKGRPLRTRTLTIVAVTDQPDGHPVITLENSAPAVRELHTCRIATLWVPGPAPFRQLELTGTVKPQGVADPGGDRDYRLSPLVGRLVGASTVPLALTQFHAARPDPLLGVAAELLEHLNRAHAAELLACIRAHGHHWAEAVVPTAVDRYGLEVTVLARSGADVVRLPFPGGPVDTLQELPPGHLIPLRCRCRDNSPR